MALFIQTLLIIIGLSWTATTIVLIYAAYTSNNEYVELWEHIAQIMIIIFVLSLSIMSWTGLYFLIR